jgi:hypothetical protein
VRNQDREDEFDIDGRAVNARPLPEPPPPPVDPNDPMTSSGQSANKAQKAAPPKPGPPPRPRPVRPKVGALTSRRGEADEKAKALQMGDEVEWAQPGGERGGGFVLGPFDQRSMHVYDDETGHHYVVDNTRIIQRWDNSRTMSPEERVDMAEEAERAVRDLESKSKSAARRQLYGQLRRRAARIHGRRRAVLDDPEGARPLDPQKERERDVDEARAWYGAKAKSLREKIARNYPFHRIPLSVRNKSGHPPIPRSKADAQMLVREFTETAELLRQWKGGKITKEGLGEARDELENRTDAQIKATRKALKGKQKQVASKPWLAPPNVYPRGKRPKAPPKAPDPPPPWWADLRDLDHEENGEPPPRPRLVEARRPAEVVMPKAVSESPQPTEEDRWAYLDQP